MEIILASDHGGFELKSVLVEHLKILGYNVKDAGPYALHHEDDYPDYVLPAVKELQNNQDSALLILICRNGVGVSMYANKFPFVRCALTWEAKHAASSKKDDNTNALALPADYISKETAKEIVEAWLTTPFSGEDRHLRRLKKIAESL